MAITRRNRVRTIRRLFALGAVLMLVGAIGYASLSRTAGASGPVPAASAPQATLVATASGSASVVIPANAQHVGYATTMVTLARGGTLTAVNLDAMEHTVTSVARDARGTPLFDAFVEPGETTTVSGVNKLAAGRYPFYCEFHPTMKGTLVVAGSGSGGVHPVAPKFEQPLVTPKALTGANLHITVRRALVRVLPHGPKTLMWTFGGSYPGPTIIRPAGQKTTVTFTNHLPVKPGDSVTVHLHGDHHSSANDGQPTRYLIRPGGHRTYTYPLIDAGRPEPAAFDFYHDHLMNETSQHNWLGLQGMFITHDKHEAALQLPSGKYDVPLMVSDRSFHANNQLTNPFSDRSAGMSGHTGAGAPPGDQTVGNQILVDGRYAPYLRVSAHRYRLRLLNASNFQSYDFALSDGQPFIQIGTGTSLLPKSVVRQDILLGPAQRADVIVDFHGALHHSIILESIPRSDGSTTGVGTPSAAIMQFRVVQTARDTSRLPATLVRAPAITAPIHPTMTWTLGLGGNTTTGTYWTINGRPYDPHRIDARVLLGTTQTWLIKNNTTITHYIHLHEEQWHTIRRDGAPPPPWERGLVDTWRLDPGESIEVAAKFTDYTGIFMLHCHMLDHEDDGMMAQFDVVRKRTDPPPHGYYLIGSPAARRYATAFAAPTTSTDEMTSPGLLPPLPLSHATETPMRLTQQNSWRRAAEAVAIEILIAIMLMLLLLFVP